MMGAKRIVLLSESETASEAYREGTSQHRSAVQSPGALEEKKSAVVQPDDINACEGRSGFFFAGEGRGTRDPVSANPSAHERPIPVSTNPHAHEAPAPISTNQLHAPRSPIPVLPTNIHASESSVPVSTKNMG